MEFPNPAENMKKMNPADQTEDMREERRSVIHWSFVLKIKQTVKRFSIYWIKDLQRYVYIESFGVCLLLIKDTEITLIIW